MKNLLKTFFDFLAVTAGEAVLLALLTAAGIVSFIWGGCSAGAWPTLEEPEKLLQNIPFLLGIGILVFNFFIYLGCMHNPDRRRTILCVLVSLVLHGVLLWGCQDFIVGINPAKETETEVALNLHSKAPILVNDYYYGELEGDEVFETPEERAEREKEEREIAEANAETEYQNPLMPTVTPNQEQLQKELERNVDSLKELEEQTETETEPGAEDARSKAEEIQLSEVETLELEKEISQEGKTESFVDTQKISPKVSADGLIGAEFAPELRAGIEEIESADALQQKKVNLRDEARKKGQNRSAFAQKLESAAQKNARKVSETPSKTPSKGRKSSAPKSEEAKVQVSRKLAENSKTSTSIDQKWTVKSSAFREGKNEVSGIAQNAGEAAVAGKPGGVGESKEDLRAGLGEEAGPARGAASVKVAKEIASPSPRKKIKRKIAVSDAPSNVAGGQTMGARAGDAENLEALLAGAVNGVSDAVLETSAKAEKFTGSNVLKTEKEEILENVVVFQFEESVIPEMGFQFDARQNADELREELLKEIAEAQKEDGAENADSVSPDLGTESAVSDILADGGAFIPKPTLPFQQRQLQEHQEMILKAGGDPASEEMVKRGLQFMKRTQFPDGRWSFNLLPEEAAKKIDSKTAGLGIFHADTAATGLALLAYLGAGHTHKGSLSKGKISSENEYSDTVNRGLNWLLRNQQADGSLFQEKTDTNRYGRIYAHGIAAIALCEAYGLTQDPRLRDPAQRAINFILQAQAPTGGWRYVPETGESWRRESDTSVSGWQTMALVSAKMANLEVPDSAFENLEKWIHTAAIDGGSRFCYLPVETPLNEEMENWKKPSYAMTAEGLLMQLYLNHDSQDSKFQEAADFLMTNLPTVTNQRRDTYYWYYATQVLFHLNDERWMEWQKELVSALKHSQERENEVLNGSWAPDSPAPDYWGLAAGRHYVTAMHLLLLEVYYRHLPLFKELEKKSNLQVP